MVLADVNYPAVLLSGVLIFMLGGLWYSPVLFARRWVALIGRSEEELKASAGSMPLNYFAVFMCGLITAWVLAQVIAHFSPAGAVEGALIALMCWVGFAGVTSYGTAVFSSKPKELWLIDSGFNLVSFVVAGIVLTLWR